MDLKACLSSPPEPSEPLHLLDTSRDVALFRRVMVELPISCRMPLDTRRPLDGVRTSVVDGGTFSVPESPAADQVLDGIDLGVRFLVGTVPPRKPALRSCSFLACREPPGRR